MLLVAMYRAAPIGIKVELRAIAIVNSSFAGCDGLYMSPSMRYEGLKPCLIFLQTLFRIPLSIENCPGLGSGEGMLSSGWDVSPPN